MEKNLDSSAHKLTQRVIHTTGSREEEKYAGKLVCVLIQMDEDLLNFLQAEAISYKHIFQDGEEENFKKQWAKDKNRALYNIFFLYAWTVNIWEDSCRGDTLCENTRERWVSCYFGFISKYERTNTCFPEETIW